MPKYHYTALGLKEDCSHQEIKDAYRKLSDIYHPDKQDGDESIQIELNAAHEILGNKAKRILYDRKGDPEQIPCSVEDMAIVVLKEYFLEIIKINFQGDIMFEHTLEFVEEKLDDLEEKKRDVEDNIFKMKQIILRLETMLIQKVKPKMNILFEAITEEITSLNQLLKSVQLGQLNFDIQVHEKIIEILKSDYPIEGLYYIGFDTGEGYQV